MSYQVPDFDGLDFYLSCFSRNLIPQDWHLGHSLPEISRWTLGTSALRVPDLLLCPSSPAEAGAGHCSAGPMAIASSSGAAHTNCSSTSSCSFNPGFGAVENHRKGKNPSQNPSHVVITSWSLFKKTPSLLKSEYRQLSCFKKLAAAHCWLPNTCFLPRFQISTVGSVYS